MFNLKSGNSKELIIKLIRNAPPLGIIQFIILTTIASTFYPGGFNFYSQYFSELGATIAINGESNYTSSSLFSVSNTVIGLTLIPFWFEISSKFRYAKGAGTAKKIGSLLGLMSSPFIIGAANYPIDTQFKMHYQMFMVFFPLFNCASLIYSIILILDYRSRKKYGILGLFLFMTSLLVIINPSASYVPFIQKMILYGYFIWVFLISRMMHGIHNLHVQNIRADII